MTSYFIDDVTEGMILNVEIQDDLGLVVHRKGEVLTFELIKAIKHLGYLTLEVIEPEQNRNTNQKLISTEEMLSPKIDKVFKNYESNPLMMKIKELALESIRKFATMQQHEV